MEQSERRYSPKEASALLGRDADTVRRWIRSGRLKAITEPGGQYRILESELAKYGAVEKRP